MAIDKPSIEKREYERFLQAYKAGDMGKQRLGQAFYNHFSLHKLSNQTQLNNLYAKDGEHAMRSIQEIFSLT